MASAQPQYSEQLQSLQERFSQEPKKRLFNLLQKHNGDADQVRHFFCFDIFLSPQMPPTRENGGDRCLYRHKTIKSSILHNFHSTSVL